MAIVFVGIDLAKDVFAVHELALLAASAPGLPSRAEPTRTMGE